METTIVYWGYKVILEKKMETTIVYWGYIRVMEKKMESTFVCWGYIGIICHICTCPPCWQTHSEPSVNRRVAKKPSNSSGLTQSSNYGTLPGPGDLPEDAPTANWPFDPVKGFRIQRLGFSI